MLHYNTHVPSCPVIGLCFNISIKKIKLFTFETVSIYTRQFIFFFFFFFFFSRTMMLYGLYFGTFDIYIGIRDICPKTISGYLNKITKRYAIFVVNYFRNGILGPHPTNTNLHDVPDQNTRQTKCKHPLTIWHGRIESIALQIRCWVRTTGLLRQPFAIAIHLCTQMTVVRSNIFAFWPARCKHQNAVSLPPCDTSNGVIPLANWWRHVQGR